MEKLILSVLVFMSVWFSCLAQDAEVVAFKAEELNGKVKLSWTIKAGGTCNGIGIERSTQAGGFVEVGSLEGVCGNLSFPTFYEYTDTDPLKNQINFYRLNLGGSGYSETVSIQVIVLGKDNYLIFGNPLESESQLFFRNDTAAEIVIQFFNLKGELDVEYTTNAKSIELNRADFGSSGLRIFKISSEETGTVVEGRLMVN